jgi:hypothetical protein
MGIVAGVISGHSVGNFVYDDESNDQKLDRCITAWVVWKSEELAAATYWPEAIYASGRNDLDNF